jgi:hypothetical protein
MQTKGLGDAANEHHEVNVLCDLLPGVEAEFRPESLLESRTTLGLGTRSAQSLC